MSRPAYDVERQTKTALQRKTAGGTRRQYAGQSIQPLNCIANYLGDSGGFVKTTPGEGHVHRNDVVSVEARIDGSKSQKSSNEQSGADQQNQCESSLAYDEQRTGFVLAEAGAGPPAALFQGGAKIGAGSVERRNETEHNSGQQGDEQRESENGPIQANRGAMFADARNIAGADGEQCADAKNSEEQTNDAARHRQHDAFSQQLTDDPSTAGAESGANRDLAFAPSGAGQEQIGDIGAGDQ